VVALLANGGNQESIMMYSLLKVPELINDEVVVLGISCDGHDGDLNIASNHHMGSKSGSIEGLMFCVFISLENSSDQRSMSELGIFGEARSVQFASEGSSGTVGGFAVVDDLVILSTTVIKDQGISDIQRLVVDSYVVDIESHLLESFVEPDLVSKDIVNIGVQNDSFGGEDFLHVRRKDVYWETHTMLGQGHHKNCC